MPVTGLVIVVNYNQELEIARFLESLATMELGLGVTIVDDGSTDRSPEIAEAMGCHVIRRGTNRGVGAAIRTGIDYARQSAVDFVVIMSSNGKMRSEEIATVIDPITTGGADYVQGSRFLAGGRSVALSTFRSAAIPAYSLLASAILRRRFTDITCGFRAYRLALFNHPEIDLHQSWLDRYELELYIHYYACRLGARIVEVPVTIDYSGLASGRKSKMRPFSGWWSLFRPLLLLAAGIRR